MAIVFLVFIIVSSVCFFSYKRYKKKKAELDAKYYKHLREPMH